MSFDNFMHQIAITQAGGKLEGKKKGQMGNVPLPPSGGECSFQRQYADSHISRYTLSND